MTRAPSDRFRDQLLDAIAPIAGEMGWTRRAVDAAAQAAKLSQGEAMLAAPRGAIDLMDAFAERADQVMLAELAALDLAAMRIRDKVRAAVVARLRAQFPFKEAAKAMSRALAARPGEAARILWRTADRIWRALNDPSTDGNYYSKRAILAGVLASTYARWFSDDDPDAAATFAFLDARIENVMQFETFKAKRLKPLGEMAEDAVGFIARLRYGG
ncbi:MAG: COQ9 family protein [Hydrogenophilaceae bacterium]|jgi:ubiquinone biosynthesis protein COQ9|nr:COQ9 family protein [Hydrogenophilaceae bacterium]